MDLVRASAKFIVKNIAPILAVVLIIFLITSYMAIHNVIFLKSNPILERVVVIEGLESSGVAGQDRYAATGQQIFVERQLDKAESALGDDLGMAMGTSELDLPERFCQIHLTDLDAGDKACRELLTSDTCNLTDCCIWASHKMDGELCVAGDHLGATFDSQNYNTKFTFQGEEHPR